MSLYFADQPEKFYTDYFKNHQITKLGDNFYRWGELGTGIFSCTIIITDSRLIIYGDLYDWMFAAGKDRTMPFLRQVCKHNNFQYFTEKITTKETPYSPEETKKYLINYISDEDYIPSHECLQAIFTSSEYAIYLESDDEKTIDAETKIKLLSYIESLDYEDHHEIMAFARNLGMEPDYETLVYSWYNTQAVWIFFALKTFMMQHEPELFIPINPKEAIRAEFYKYLITLGHSSENIQTAWDAVINLYPDELTREVTCRDLLNISEKARKKHD